MMPLKGNTKRTQDRRKRKVRVLTPQHQEKIYNSLARKVKNKQDNKSKKRNKQNYYFISSLTRKLPSVLLPKIQVHLVEILKKKGM